VDGRAQSYPTACPQWEPHSESYDPAHPFRVMVWYGVAPLRAPTAYKAWQTLSICMKWIWCEYELDGGPNHILQHVPSENPTQYPTTGPPPSRVMAWYGVVANMNASHGWRLYNTFCRYEVDLVWVCRGWEGPIISYSKSPVRTPLTLRILLLIPSPPPTLLEWWYGMMLHP
jgi:hypothetical protein